MFISALETRMQTPYSQDPELIEKQRLLAESNREALVVTLEMLRRHDPDRAHMQVARMEGAVTDPKSVSW